MPPPLPDDSEALSAASSADEDGDAELTLREIADATGLYPVEAFDFVQRGLLHTVLEVHGRLVIPGKSRHVSGQQLAVGLRNYALHRWGMMARTVLKRWNITATLDFGNIVFSLVHAELLKTTEADTLEDFRDVYDFSTFDSGYRIESKL